MTNGNLSRASFGREKIQLSAVGMALFFLMLPFEYPLAELTEYSPLRYVSILVMGLALVDILFSDGILRLDKRMVMLLAWLAFAVVSVLWCSSKEGYQEHISIYFNNTAMFLLVAAVGYSNRSYKLAEKSFIAGTVLLLLYMTFVPDATVESDWQSRLTLAFDGEALLDQNYLAALMTMQYGMLLYDVLVEKERNKHRILKLIIVVAILYYVLRAGSRGGLLSIGVITAICVIMGVKKNIWKILLLIVASLLVVPYMLTFIPEDVLERFSLKELLGQTEDSGSRLEIWAVAWEAVRSGNFVLGYGAGSALDVIGSAYRKNAATHNAYLAQLLELGLVGLGLFCGVMWSAARELFRSKYVRLGIAFVGILVTSMFLDVITTKFFWASMMLVVMRINSGRGNQIPAHQMAEENKTDKQPPEVSDISK